MITEQFKAKILGSFTILCAKGLTPVPFYGPSVIIKKKMLQFSAIHTGFKGAFTIASIHM